MNIGDMKVLARRPGRLKLPAQNNETLKAHPDSVAIQAASAQLQQLEVVPDELLLGVDSSEGFQGASLMASSGSAVIEEFPGEDQNSGIVRIQLPPGTDLAQAMVNFSEQPGVRFAEPNRIIRLAQTPETESSFASKEDMSRPDDLDAQLWGLDNQANNGADISAKSAWKISTGDRDGPMIAVLDSGADYHHPDLKDNIAVNANEIPGDGIDNDGNGVIDDVFGYYAFEDNGDPMDGMGHGTHVTGTIAAVGNNGQGIVGVNWEANVLPVKIFHDRGLTTLDSILRGIHYADSRGARITSNSWGGPSGSPAIEEAFRNSPALHLAASGNDGQNTDVKDSFPANYDMPNMISVGASTSADEAAGFSNYGRETVDLFAPGQDILSTKPGGTYASHSGTSMATPHVSGVAGLIATVYPEASNAELRDRLLYGSDAKEAFADISVSGGRLNAARALSTDLIAPGAPNDFTPTQITSRKAQFSWTSPGDDGWKNGAASGFEVRTSSEPITEENFDQAAPLSTPRGKEIGDHLHATYRQTPESADTLVYAAFKSVDEVGNRSELRTTQAVLPAAPSVYSDDFEGDDTAWKADGKWSLRSEPGRGKVWSSEYGERSNGAFSELETPLIDLAASESSFLRFDSKQTFSWSNNTFVDIARGPDGDWERLTSLEDRGQWKRREFDLSEFDGDSIRLRIRSESLGAKEGEGVLIDRFEILSERSL